MKPFEDYKSEVLLAYQKKKEERSLSLDLLNHTPASLKRECINVFPSRYCEKDKETFKSLFGPADSKEEYYQKIRAADPDIFRPLNYFLKGRILKTHERNIHLLAWLINFDSDPKENIGPPIVPPPPPPSLLVRIKTWVRDRFKKRNLPHTLVIVIVSAFILCYIIQTPIAMYWNGKEYIPLAFYQDVPGVNIIEIDNYRLHHLKRITNLKLITRNDIGKVHYSKVKCKVQFYTIRGADPENTAKDLKPMTEYMYEKYVLKLPKFLYLKDCY